MSQSPPWRLSTLLWCVAFVALALAGMIVPADAQGVTGVALGGSLIWIVAYALDDQTRRTKPSQAPRRLVPTVLAVAGLLELLAGLATMAERERDQSIWFASALVFAVFGIVTARRREPGDGTFAVQIFFHTLMLVPALAMLVNAYLDARARSGIIGAAGPLTRVLILVTGVALPILFTALVTVLAYDVNRERENSDLPWSTLLASQAAYTVVLFRWAGLTGV
jgi:uncharacterized membrane protein